MKNRRKGFAVSMIPEAHANATRLALKFGLSRARIVSALLAFAAQMTDDNAAKIFVRKPKKGERA